MAARTARVWPLGLAVAAVLAAAGPARSADVDGPVVSAQVVLRNTDLDTGAPLTGAAFELWREVNDQQGLQTTGPAADEKHEGACVTDAKGTCTVELPAGETYYWRETVVPAGYGTPEDPVTAFTVAETDAKAGIVLNVAHRKQGAEYSGRIRILKEDAKTGSRLGGAVFELWKETNSTERLQTRGINADQRVRPGCATDQKGVCDFDGLPEGEYYLLETDVPEGYVLPETPVTGPLSLDDETGGRRVVTLENERDPYAGVPIKDSDEDARRMRRWSGLLTPSAEQHGPYARPAG
ncbi:SpaA isopeptide-forming pilin-related protein [Streptomyces sp. NPDC048269]|uniref:MSCRAMM family protein n=1 Tax=Streptomyces sp. NPDC048269 TaxID=3155753 RepID=UPI003436E081